MRVVFIGHVLEFPSPLGKSMYVGLAGSSNFASFAILRTDMSSRKKYWRQKKKRAKISTLSQKWQNIAARDCVYFWQHASRRESTSTTATQYAVLEAWRTTHSTSDAATMHDSLLFLNSHRRFQSSSLIFSIYWPFSAPTSAFIDASSIIFSSAAHSLPPSESLIFCPYHHFRPFFPPPLTIFISSHYLIYPQTRGRFSARIAHYWEHFLTYGQL